MIVPNGLNLLSLLKRNKKIDIKEVENGIKELHEAKKGIELYCQNPLCKEALIKEGEEVVEVGGALVHQDMRCMSSYGSSKTLEAEERTFYSEFNHIPYAQAERLARKGKVKFSRLENKKPYEAPSIRELTLDETEKYLENRR